MHLTHRTRERDPRSALFLLFALEGILLQFTGSINNFANPLYATNLGATDAQIALIQTIPNVLAMLLMLPLGVLSERARTSRTFPLIMLLSMAVGYVIMSLAPAAGTACMPVFFLALAFTMGGTALYNTQWQSFFGDVVAMDDRNQVLTVRNRWMFIVGIIAPLVCGVAMNAFTDTRSKLTVLQVFFVLCAAVTALQFADVSHIPTPQRPKDRAGSFTLADVGQTVRALAHSRPFLLFFIPMVLFYMSWQIDWTMWYIGQVQYLNFTEMDLSIFNGVFNVGQLIAVGVLSRVVRRRGPDYGMIFAALGLVFCPLIMTLCTYLPQPARMPVFTVLCTTLNATQCAVNLCVIQILLRVAPEKNRTLAVSLFTLTTTLTNSFMPMVGVQVYTLFGADHRGLVLSCLVSFALRTAVFALLIWRYRKIKKES